MKAVFRHVTLEIFTVGVFEEVLKSYSVCISFVSCFLCVVCEKNQFKDRTGWYEFFGNPLLRYTTDFYTVPTYK